VILLSFAVRTQAKKILACLMIPLLGVCGYFSMRAWCRHLAYQMWFELDNLDAAVDQWSIEHITVGDDLPTWPIIKVYFYPKNVLIRRDGKDPLGRPYIIGSKDEGNTVDPATLRQLEWVLKPGALDYYDDGTQRLRAPDLILAARQNDMKRLRALLAAGANIDQTDKAGRTPLYWAAELGHIEMARFLCEHEPNPYAAIMRKFNHHPPALFEAISNDHPEIVSLFLDYGAWPEPYYLPYAVTHADVVKVLLAYGLSPDAKDSIGEPMILRAVFDSKETVRMLIDAGANVNVVGNRGETPLQNAYRRNNFDIVTMLRAAGEKE